ncbi:hypothetical protein [Altererythrobacter aquiaggeris]|uniref:hypothetical protein n=1 Tax=Aestuarierythrobacter aquiaggeris TaxID=1898396 RepID=UPI00301A1A40
MTQLSSSFYHADLLEAWKLATSRLVDEPTKPYVIVTSFGNAWVGGAEEVGALNIAAKSAGFEAPSSVASVLCPRIVRQAKGSAFDALNAGQVVFGRGRRRGIRYSGWRHTYFERLSGSWYDRFGQKRTIKANRLLEAITKLNAWQMNSEAALYLHTDLPSDTFRTRGSPCLQYVQIRSFGVHELSLGAVYRSHDFSNKALGNFLGLAELGNFIAERTGRTFKGADVVSFNPFVGTKSNTNDFIGKI